MQSVTYHRDRDVAVITINNPPVNALNASTRSSLVSALRRFRDDDARAAVMLGAAGRFVAGADIREVGTAHSGPSLQAIVAEMQGAGKPILAAMEGHALGGGLELALGAMYRVAVAGTGLGFPEINIGLLPGGGGTQRLPRLVGVETALDLMLSGKPIPAAKALDIGLVDAVVDGELLPQALCFLRERLSSSDQGNEVGPLLANPVVPEGLFESVRRLNDRRWRGLLAPWLIVDCVERSVSVPLAEGLEFESQAFERCAQSPQRAALSHLFHAERAAAKVPGLESVEPRPVRTAAVVGAGMMGSGIAMCFANAGIPVVVIDSDSEALHRGIGRIRDLYKRSVSRGSMTGPDAENALSLISASMEFTSVRDCDLIVEAAFEDMDVKKGIFSRLDEVAKQGAVLATNTSTLDIDQIAASTSRPKAVVGTHFFSPANVMKLQENVRGAKTAAQVLATVTALARRLGKVPVLALNRDGFIGNRILAAYGRECDFLLEEGAMPWQIDAALKTFGFPMGLYLMRDMAGLDISWRVRQYREAFRDKSLRYSTIADRLCEMGRFGRKVGKGYYQYASSGVDADASLDPQVEAVVVAAANDAGIARRPVEDTEILDRALCAMVNEGARILEEGVALRAADIDVVYVLGYGFPRHLGGPMYWAEQRGLAEVLEYVRQQHASQGRHWKPAAALETAASRGRWAE